MAVSSKACCRHWKDAHRRVRSRLAHGLSLFAPLLFGCAATCTAGLDYFHPYAELNLRSSFNVSSLNEDAGTPPLSIETKDKHYFRLRAGAEAGWESGVAAGFALQAVGLWSGANGDDDVDAGVPETWLALSEIGYLPLSVTVGRQSIQFGRGLLVSDFEHAWSFDAIRAQYDAFPVAWEIMAGQPTHLSPDTPLKRVGLARMTHEPSASLVRERELCGGVLEARDGAMIFPFGGRLELMPSPELLVWSEFVYETGETLCKDSLSAWIGDLGCEYSFRKVDFRTVFRTRWTSASGDGANGGRDFIPMMDRGVGGMILRPRLSNIHILQIGVELPVTQWARVCLDAYGYRRYEAENGAVGIAGGIYEGLTIPANDGSRDLGWETNIAFDLEYKEGSLFRVAAGLFRFGDAYGDVPENEVFEVRVEVVWKY